jgi:two-component system KDP operon response regulator KdpE
VTDSAPKVLIVEDEAHMRRFLQTTLVHNGYDTVEATNGTRALELARSAEPDLVLLDLGLPDIDGVVIAARVREHSAVPIIVISARDFEDAKIEALDRGANDYVTKPFGAGELLARIRVALRVAQGGGQAASSVFIVGGLRVDLEHRRVWLNEEEVHLTPNEYSLLAYMAERAGRVVRHRELLRHVWGPDSTEEVQYLRVYMRQLRYKLEPEPAQPRYLVTVSGVGYRLNAEG